MIRPRSALLLVCALTACRADKAPADGPAPTASGSSTSSAAPAPTSTAAAGIPKEVVAQTLNPKQEPPYQGPTGTLRGVVKVSGDPPPSQQLSLPRGCGAAAGTYDKLFRVGQDQTVADVLVAVVGYQGYVPPSESHQTVEISECAYSTRTVALTFGQYLQVRNRDDRRSYLPVLIGAHLPAKLVAIPRGSVKLYAPKPGRYLLTDEMGNSHMKADVFVLKYPTFDVTGLDGRYEIAGLPTGVAQLSALLPAADMTVVRQRVTIQPGDNTVDLTIPFDANPTDTDAGTPPTDGG